MEARRISILLAPGFPPHSQASTRHIRETLTIALREQDRGGHEVYRHIALLSKVTEAILATTTSYITETFHLLPESTMKAERATGGTHTAQRSMSARHRMKAKWQHSCC